MALELDYVRVVADLVATELARLRRSTTLHGPLSRLDRSTSLDAAGLGVDSLELLHLAGLLNEMFHLHESSVQDYLLQQRTVGAWAEVVAAGRAAAPERITFRTSGSTGESKPCVHHWLTLQEEASAHARRLRGVARVVSFVPSHHIYGFLFTIVLPALLRVPAVDARTWSPGRLGTDLRGDDLVVAVPSFWQFLERTVPAWPPGVRGITSTAPCPPALFNALRARGLELQEIYGSSEIGGLGFRSGADEPFELLPGWARIGEQLCRTAPPVSPAGAAVAPPDRLEWIDTRHFRLAGRLDGAVQVGGTNVFPAHIARRIAAHPRVAECAVRLMRPEEGERLKAFVVWRKPAPDAAARDEFHAWLQRELTTPERPVAIASGPRLPCNDLGKLTDWDV
jgi:4-coumarate--CoA ligase